MSRFFIRSTRSGVAPLRASIAVCVQYIRTSAGIRSESSAPASPNTPESLPIRLGKNRPPVDPDLPFLEFRKVVYKDKSPVTLAVKQNVAVSKGTSPASLVDALRSLVSEDVEQPKSVGSKGWRLDPCGNAIHRYLAVESEQTLATIYNEVNSTATELNHHPTITTRAPEPLFGGCAVMILTCSTHNPSGLSMRDIRLARKIDEIVAPYNTTAWLLTTSDGKSSPPGLNDISLARNRLVCANRDKLNGALKRLKPKPKFSDAGAID